MFTTIISGSARTMMKDNPLQSILHQIVRTVLPVNISIPFILVSNKTIHTPVTICGFRETSWDVTHPSARIHIEFC